MKVAISQPTFLPWLGYLDLIDQVDAFVLLDNVQFEKQSWQQRNRIKGPSGLQWLSVPVVSRGHFGQRINEVVIRDAGFPANHLRAIELSYRRAPFFDQYFPQVRRIFEAHPVGSMLADLNVELIRWLCQMFAIPTPLRRSSERNLAGRRSDLLVNICLDLGATAYISAPGAAAYLLEDVSKFSKQGIDVTFHQYQHPEYDQRFSPFMPYASSLDLLFNEGQRSNEILRTGRGLPISPAELHSFVSPGASA